MKLYIIKERHYSDTGSEYYDIVSVCTTKEKKDKVLAAYPYFEVQEIEADTLYPDGIQL